MKSKNFILIILFSFIFSQKILIPMDNTQKDHLKAYGFAFWVLQQKDNVDWLLNYRGGAFLVDAKENYNNETKLRGISAIYVTNNELNTIYQNIEENNMSIVLLEKLPKIAVYSPPDKQPWDDAVTLALTYAEVDYDIIFEKNRLKNNSKIIFLNNTAYNFWRIIKEAKKNKYQIIFPIFKKMNFFKKGILYLYNVYPIFLKKKSKINKFEFYNKDKLRIIYKDIDISNILKKTIDEKLYHLNDLLAKAKILKQFFRKQKISLAILNLLRGLDGCIAEILKKTPIPTVSVSHGTVSEYFNQVDKIYKYNILESVFAGDCKYTAISSKISLSAHKKFKIKSKPLMGNIIFSGLKNVRKTNNILFAVTLKDFENFQLHGVETHFEFINNLATLSRLAKKNNLNFIINLHPSQHNQINRLMNIFPKLEFTKSKIESVLKKSFATISFSSSVIEDSITSNIPVILFDPHNRYKHCKAETKLNKISRGIYYINNEEKLLKCINFIRDNIDKIETKKNNFNDDYKYNINNNLFSLIKT